MNDIKVGRRLTKNILEVWCNGEEDMKRIFALDCVAAIMPSLSQFTLRKDRCYGVLIDARYDPEVAIRRIEALGVEVPEVFKSAWDE